MEEALRIKEAFPDTLVDVISVGPARAADAIRRALGMGADNGIHVVTGEGQVPDAYQTAWWIASFARDRGYRLILAGAMSEDLMQGQVGPMIAELLSMPCATFVVDQRIQADNGTVIAQRGIEGGYRQTVELDLPAVLTLQASINRPRYPSLSNMLRAGKQDLEIVEPDPLEQAGPRMETIRLETPEKSRSGVVLGNHETEGRASVGDSA